MNISAETVAGRILIVEDDAGLAQVITGALSRAGNSVERADSGLTGAQMLKEHEYDVILLDIGLPFIDGWQILHSLEGKAQPSVIVISARGDEADKIRALDMGADDYLTKPFGAGELLARVRAVLRRVRGSQEAAKTIKARNVVIDLGARAVIKSGAPVRLSPTEYVLLLELAKNAGKVMDHRTLLGRVWGASYAGDRNYLHTFIQRLRRKLESDPSHPELIVTVGREGYRFGPIHGH